MLLMGVMKETNFLFLNKIADFWASPTEVLSKMIKKHDEFESHSISSTTRTLQIFEQKINIKAP